MLKHVVNYLSKKTKIKKNDYVLDIASNDGSLLNFYNKNIKTFGIDPILEKYKKIIKILIIKLEIFFSQTNKKNQTKNLK